jgi:hypothetical protein
MWTCKFYINIQFIHVHICTFNSNMQIYANSIHSREYMRILYAYSIHTCEYMHIQLTSVKICVFTSYTWMYACMRMRFIHVNACKFNMYDSRVVTRVKMKTQKSCHMCHDERYTCLVTSCHYQPTHDLSQYTYARVVAINLRTRYVRIQIHKTCHTSHNADAQDLTHISPRIPTGLVTHVTWIRIRKIHDSFQDFPDACLSIWPWTKNFQHTFS